MTDYTLAKYYKRAFLCTLALFLLGVVWMCLQTPPPQPVPQIITEHDTIYNDTTIYKPTPSATTQTGKTVFVPYVITERDTVHDGDSILVPVPIEQKRYDDSLFTAWVSGYEPQLDSIQLHQPEVVTTVTRTIIKPAPRWSIGPSVGAGVSITGQQQAGIFIGFTIQYRMWPK